MANETKANRKPTHGIFHVRGEGKNAYWTQVGAAWLHEDKQGLNLSLDFIPVAGDGKLVVRVKTEKTKAEGETN